MARPSQGSFHVMLKVPRGQLEEVILALDPIRGLEFAIEPLHAPVIEHVATLPAPPKKYATKKTKEPASKKSKKAGPHKRGPKPKDKGYPHHSRRLDAEGLSGLDRVLLEAITQSKQAMPLHALHEQALAHQFSPTTVRKRLNIMVDKRRLKKVGDTWIAVGTFRPVVEVNESEISLGGA